MKRVLLMLFAYHMVAPAHSAEPPDWYAHIPAEQRAALLAARPAAAQLAEIGVNGTLTGRGHPAAVYAAPTLAPQFDLTQIGASNLSLEHHRRRHNRVDRMLREYREPEYSRIRPIERPVRSYRTTGSLRPDGSRSCRSST